MVQSWEMLISGARGDPGESEIFMMLTTGFAMRHDWQKSAEIGFLGGRERHQGAGLVVVFGRVAINHVTFSHTALQGACLLYAPLAMRTWRQRDSGFSGEGW